LSEIGGGANGHDAYWVKRKREARLLQRLALILHDE
jgi:hypothetical protein